MINITRAALLSETKRLLRSYNLRAFKSYSQNFVIEPKLINWHLQYSNLTEDDVVIEVGAGLGILTRYLAEKSSKVIAIEVDSKLVEVLREELSAYKNVEIIPGDILKLDPKIFTNTKIISNPPYRISSPLTFKIIQTSYVLCVMTYQKEFADRLVAAPGEKNYGRITLGVNYYAKVRLLKFIPKTYFYPMPKIDSALIHLTSIEHPFKLTNEKSFFEFVRHLFSFRKKSVRRALKLYLKNSEFNESQKEELLENPLSEERIFRLSIRQFHELYQLIERMKAD